MASKSASPRWVHWTRVTSPLRGDRERPGRRPDLGRAPGSIPTWVWILRPQLTGERPVRCHRVERARRRGGRSRRHGLHRTGCSLADEALEIRLPSVTGRCAGRGGEGQDRADAGVGVGLHGCLETSRAMPEVEPVDHGGDPGFDRPQQPDQGRGIGVLRLIVLAISGEERESPRLRNKDSRDVTVRVDEPGHDDGVGGVDHLGVTVPETRADFDDSVTVDQHIGLGEVGPTHGEDTSATKEELRRHQWLRAGLSNRSGRRLHRWRGEGSGEGGGRQWDVEATH